MAGQYGAQLDIGRVISRTFAALGGNLGSFFLLALLFAGLPNALVGYAVQQYIGPSVLQASSSSNYALNIFLLQMGISAVLLIPTYILIGALTHGAIMFLNGGRASFGECLGTGLGRSLPLIALGVLSTLGLMFFFLLLIIPGLMVATRWAVTAPALVAERIGVFDAFGRSGELARDNRWRIFWLMVIWAVASFLIQFAIEAAMAYMFGSMNLFGEYAIWAEYAIVAMYTAMTSMIGATGAAALYCELRATKEGATSEQLAKVFE